MTKTKTSIYRSMFFTRLFVCCLVILLTTTFSYSQNTPGIELVSEPLVTGYGSDVKIVGSNIFFSNRYGVVIYSFDTENPEQPPVEVSHFSTPGLSGGLWIEDTLMYLCDDYTGLRIYDISDLSNVVELSVCADARGARNVKVRDNLAYVIRSRYGFYIVDVENPFNPEVIGEWRSPGMHMSIQGRSFEIKDDLLFCGFNHFSHSLAVFNISDPTNPEFMFEYEEIEFYDFCIVDDILFMTDNDRLYGAIYSLSIENLDNIHVIDEIRGNNECYINGPIHYENGFLYNHWSGVKIYDVRDPENMVQISRIGRRIPPSNEVPSVVMGDFVFGCAKWHGLFVIDFSDIDEPEIIHSSLSHGRPISTCKQGNYLYVVDGVSSDHTIRHSSQFRVFSIEDIFNPVQVSVFDYPDRDLSLISVDGNYAYLVPGQGGRVTELIVFNIEDSENPELIATIDCAGLDMLLVDDMLYISRGSTVLIISVADPENPFRLPLFIIEEHYDDRYRANSIAISGDLMYTPGSIPLGEGNSWEQGLTIWDKSDLNNIQLVGECALRVNSAHRIAIYNNYVYITSKNGVDGLSIVDVSDAANPREVLFMDDIIYATNVKVFDDLLFVLEICYGVKIFSLENPARPELIGQYDTPSLLMNIDVDLAEGYMYVAEYDDISIYDIARFTGLWDVTLSEESYDYGDVPIDSTALWTVVVTNRGMESVTITGNTIGDGAFTADLFGVRILEPGTETNVDIRFTPRVDSAYTRTITISAGIRNLEVNLSGTGININEVSHSEDNLPLKFVITSIIPNPFNSQTTLSFNLPKAGNVQMDIFDINGRKVKTLIDGFTNTGSHSVNWEAHDISAGLYIVKLTASGKSHAQKIAVLK